MNDIVVGEKSNNCLEGCRFPATDNLITFQSLNSYRLEGTEMINNDVIKICTRCHIEKPISEFYKDIKYVRSECKECRKKLSQKYGHENRAKINIRRHSKGSTYKKWRKEYDLLHKDHQEKQEKKWRLTPKGVFCSIHARALKYNIPFNLVKKVFINWYSKADKRCTYCGISETENMKYRGHNSLRLTIDRKNSIYGYEQNNIVLACAICNTVKNNILTFEQMLEVGKMIKENRLKGLIIESKRNKFTKELGGCYDAVEMETQDNIK